MEDRDGLFDILFTRSETMSYTIAAKSEVEAAEIARRLLESDVFKARLHRDLDECDAWREIDVETQEASDLEPSISARQVNAYLDKHPTPPVKADVVFQVWQHDYAIDVRTERWDVSYVLDSIYALDELPTQASGFRKDEYNCGDDIFRAAEEFYGRPFWDGPFELFVKDGYEVYLGTRLAEELASLEAVLDWFEARSGFDILQMPADEIPDWASATVDASERRLTELGIMQSQSPTSQLSR